MSRPYTPQQPDDLVSPSAASTASGSGSDSEWTSLSLTGIPTTSRSPSVVSAGFSRSSTWEMARARSAEIAASSYHNPATPSTPRAGTPSHHVNSFNHRRQYSHDIQPDQNIFGRAFSTLSSAIPRFSSSHSYSGPFAEKEKLGRGRWSPTSGRPRQGFSRFLRQLWRMRLRLGLLLISAFFVLSFFSNALHFAYERSPWGGQGKKFVILLAANVGGGVVEWKGAREWAIERDSIRNKKAYARRWGYDIKVVDMTTKKRYAHEWRESWQKVDILKQAMKDFPEAEWFWWLDINTFIMEPSYSLQAHIFHDLDRVSYRDINIFNPLNITHPLNDTHLDPISRSATGDNKPSSINLLIPQDCGGFNLGSFFIKRGTFADRLLDAWWDPVAYDQRHMQWEHKEQDALEYMYTAQPWIRTGTAFLYNRVANSFPPGACGADDPSLHYREQDRDFVLSMAGCDTGRDCWSEMFHFRELSTVLNRSRFAKFKLAIAARVVEAKKRLGWL